ncbi:MAG: HlyD family efflux transporter periplasmic adaptor subunit [Chloroflexi bacterium]|nr:HlyD family efflux transporter periplasmic adaptor subunit [Chloroflexota bacterium]
MNKTKLIGGIILVFVLVFLGYFGYQNYLAPIPPTPTPFPQTNAQDDGPVLVSAEGRVIPAQFGNLSFSSSGLAAEVLAAERDTVEAGQVLARLDNHAQLQANVAAALLQVVTAQQAYDDLFENLDSTRALALKAVADARDVVRDAERLVTNLNTPSRQTDINQARANRILAEDRLERAQEDYDPHANKPESNLVRAAMLSRLAQARAEYDAAVRLVNNLEGTASDIDISQAEADLEVAQATLADAERDYENLGGGPDPDALELLEAQLENANAQLAAAEDALTQQELTAPFAGTIANLNIIAGEFATPGIPVILLADFSSWQVETSDLDENDVALLAAGMSANITLDAFPNIEFAGVVLEIGLIGEDTRGSITYPVLLSFDPGETPVRWEMTAFVDIEAR